MQGPKNTTAEVDDSLVQESVPGQFVAEEWIRAGKSYKNVPEYVTQEKAKILEVPQAILDHFIPPASQPVIEFAERQSMPRVETSGLLRVRHEHAFSEDAPNVDTMRVLASRPIPCADDLRRLEDAVGQAWFDGQQSVIDWRFNDGAERHPFWVVRFWRLMTPVVEKHTAWRRGLQWLQEVQRRSAGNAETLSFANSALAALQVLGWNGMNPYLRGATTTSALALFLGTSWLGDEQLDMMYEDLKRRAEASRASVLVGSTDFARRIQLLGEKAAGWETSGHLRRTADRLKDGTYKVFVFPINISECHWITGMVDLKTNTVTYGDSLAHSFAPPTQFMDKLKSYIARSPIARAVTIKKDTLEHGKQTDSYSCGVCSQNTAARAIFGNTEPLWESSKREGARLEQFLQIARVCQAPLRVRPDIANLLDNSTVPSTSSALGHGDSDLDTASEDTIAQSRASSSDPGIDPPATSSEYTAGASSDATDVEPPCTVAGEKRKAPTSRVPSPECKRQQAKRTDMNTSPPLSSDDDDVHEKAIPRRKVGGPTGHSRSAKWERQSRADARAGTAKVDPARLAEWRDYCRARDPNVRFDPSDIRKAIHSNCGRVTTGRYVLDTARFDNHVDSCVKPPIRTIFNMLGVRAPTTSVAVKPRIAGPKAPPPVVRPCQGLKGDSVRKYLRRSMMTGGGAESEVTVAQDMFKVQTYGELSADQKADVETARVHGRRWVNHHHTEQVFAAKCHKTVLFVPGGPSAEPMPCAACTAVSTSKEFKAALAQPMPKKTNRKYTPKRFRTGIFAETYGDTVQLFDIFSKSAEGDVFLEYTVGRLEGRYDDTLLTGIVHAVLVMHSKEERGVGMQNFKYMPAYDEFMQIIFSQSPSVARLIGTHLPVRSDRSMRAQEALKPKFPLVIGPPMFVRARSQLEALGCLSEPACVAADDSKLSGELRSYWDEELRCFVAAGGDQGPVCIKSPEDLQRIRDAKALSPADKIRAVTLQVATHPKAIPILVAALALPNKVDAQFLLGWTLEIINGLLDQQINVVSYACDGTEVERSVQKLLLQSSDGLPLTHTIYNPSSGASPIVIQTACIRGHHIALVQDSKHALKTSRNNLFSGARLLVLGDYVAMYENLRTIVKEPGTPIYMRDVIRIDRQDDNAARRLSSGALLRFIADRHPDYVGVAVYLFVMGELIDAYQSRTLTHAERLKMVLTAQYFVEAWINFLNVSQYNTQHYCISREALDILRLVIHGYLSLFFIFRDELAGLKPFMPWMHGTEAVEHIFGEARKIEEDFAYMDFISFIPKMSALMRNAILHSRMSSAKGTARGYNHTYFDTEGLCLAALQQFPDDMQVSDIAEDAYHQVDSLLRMTGIDPDLLNNVKGLVRQAQVPPLEQWFPRRDPGDDSESDEEEEGLSSDEEGEDNVPRKLRALIAHAERTRDDPSYPLRSAWENLEIGKLTQATVALRVRNAMAVLFVNAPGDTEEEVLATHAEDLRAAARDLPAVLTDEGTAPVGHGMLSTSMLDLHALAEVREAHQTRQGVAGVKTRAVTAAQESAERSTRRAILRRFEAVLGAGTRQAIGTGLVRRAHYTTPAKEDGGKETGNAANAATVSKQTAAQVSRPRGTHQNVIAYPAVFRLFPAVVPSWLV
ncbi:hypothetical protein EV121DRAFT_214771 [Schizophyllum commune]